MNVNFWDMEKKFFCLAPMEDVTDTVFREVVLRNSSADELKVLFTEFLSTDGFCHERGREKVIHRLKVNKSEQTLLKEKNIKLVAQIWGTDPENFQKTAQFINEQGIFDGIDINMGCPQKNIIKKGACSALINTPSLAQEIVMATKESTSLPVSVKTRIGFKSIQTEDWTSVLLSLPIAALTIHGRTQKQMSDGLADWSEIEKVVRLRDLLKADVKIIGNGDVLSMQEGIEKIDHYGVDGIMVGRGIFNNYRLFNVNDSHPGMEERLRLMKFHAELFMDTWQGEKNWAILRRFFKIYTHKLPRAAYLRDQLMKTNNMDDLDSALMNYMKVCNVDSIVE